MARKLLSLESRGLFCSAVSLLGHMAARSKGFCLGQHL